MVPEEWNARSRFERMKPMNSRRLTQISMSVLTVVHLVPTYFHGRDHANLEVGLPPGMAWFVYGVIVGLPVVGTLILWTRWMNTALGIVTLSFVGATFFGIYHHYVMVSPDNVFHLPNGPVEFQVAFASSAGWVAVSEGLAAAVGIFWCGVAAALRFTPNRNG